MQSLKISLIFIKNNSKDNFKYSVDDTNQDKYKYLAIKLTRKDSLGRRRVFSRVGMGCVLEDPESCVREREPEPSDVTVCGLHEGESKGEKDGTLK